jgi:hypothetical protein
MQLSEKIEHLAKKPIFFTLMLFIATALFRLPTLFNPLDNHKKRPSPWALLLSLQFSYAFF